MRRQRGWLLVGLLVSAVGMARETEAADRLRVYYIGNSVTDAIQYDKLAELAAGRGYRFEWGRHMIPGAPLQWIWDHPNDGFMQKPYGYYPTALRDFEWDVITLQPFDRQLPTDARYIQQFIDLARPKSPQAQFFIYSRWPRMTIQGKSVRFNKTDYDPLKPAADRPELSQLDDWQGRWLAAYTGQWDGTNEGREYFERLLEEVRRANPDLLRPVRLIPVGDVMHRLDQLMRDGKVGEFRSIWQFYRDGIHMNAYGSYVAACTFFAALTGTTPEGLPHESYGVTDAAVARLIQKTAWEVVSARQNK